MHVDYLIIENLFIEKKNLICQKLTIVSVHVDYHLIKNLFIDFFFYLSKVDRRTIIPVSQQKKSTIIPKTTS